MTIGTRGDIQPFIALCKEFKRQVSDLVCRIASHAEYRDFVEGHGLEFRPLPGNPAIFMKIAVEHGMYTPAMMKAAYSVHKEFVDGLLAAGFEALEGTQVLIEAPSAMIGRFFAEKMNLAYMRAFFFPWTKTPAFPHPFATTWVWSKQLDYTWDLIEEMNWLGIRDAVNRFRKENGMNELGFAPPAFPQNAPFFYGFSPSVVHNTWPAHTHVTGYWFLENSEGQSWQPSHALREILRNDRDEKGEYKPIVYIGFGSIVVNNPAKLTATILKAVEKAGVRAVIAKGWSERGSSGAADHDPNDDVPKHLQSSVHILKVVPHDWLFPRMDAVVHHGGAGTLAAGMRAGKPTIVVPFALDQYLWGDRVIELGVGMVVKRYHLEGVSGQKGIDKLAKALRTVSRDQSIREKAHEIGNHIKAENGPRTAVRLMIEELRTNPKGIRLDLSNAQPADETKNPSRKLQNTPTQVIREVTHNAEKGHYCEQHSLAHEDRDGKETCDPTGWAKYNTWKYWINLATSSADIAKSMGVANHASAQNAPTLENGESSGAVDEEAGPSGSRTT
ncbi:hypothetical protein BKA69DRAFT_1125488 [Paraphysoderma sedebokerense]|nr:hypothetical protein BKA69DRAFT_1125488 [Paraphysoderma sedebokerense]